MKQKNFCRNTRFPKNMIITVNLNPCIDMQLTINSFIHGGLNRVKSVYKKCAGKGINVAIVLKNLGLDPLCTGFTFSETKHEFEKMLNEQCVNYDFIESEGSARTNIKLFENDTKTMTEINQSGPYVPKKAQDELLSKIKHLPSGILILSGSRPPGVEYDFYTHISKLYSGCIALDADGDAFKHTIENHPPFLIKPNIYELESTFNIKLPTIKDIIHFCKELISKGIEIICCSMGTDGAVLVTKDDYFHLPAIPVEVKGLQGAGDSMLAGLIYGIKKDVKGETLLQHGLAAAASSVSLDGSELCTKEIFEGFFVVS